MAPIRCVPRKLGGGAVRDYLARWTRASWLGLRGKATAVRVLRVEESRLYTFQLGASGEIQLSLGSCALPFHGSPHAESQLADFAQRVVVSCSAVCRFIEAFVRLTVNFVHHLIKTGHFKMTNPIGLRILFWSPMGSL